MGPDAMILIFWMLNFKPGFSLSSFTFIKRLFSSSSFSSIGVVLSVHLRLLIFLPEILMLACTLCSSAFHMIYSKYKLNKQGDNIQPWRIPFPILNQSVVPCPVLTVASWADTGFSGDREGGLYAYLFKNFSVYCDPPSQKLKCHQWSRIMCFSAIPLLSLWYNEW